MVDVTFCNGTYRRHPQGIWVYRWGEPVPGARDVRAPADLVRHLQHHGEASEASLLRADLHWANHLAHISAPVRVEGETGDELVVGMTAPELDVLSMLTVVDVAELAEVSKATIDSYRYRGYLPEPQVVKGRTPLWSRPVIRAWLLERPGSGWRTDIYGTDHRTDPERTMPITSAREDSVTH